MRILIIFLFWGFLRAQVTEPEGKIVAAVDVHSTEAIDLLKKVININSGTLNFKGVKEVAAVFKEEFEHLGFETRWVDGTTFKRSGHLIASHKGTGRGTKLLLIGHLDTVFEPESPFQHYKMLNDSLMQGPGVADMKGGNVIIVLVLKALKEAGLLETMHIRVVFSGDEERMGGPADIARKDLIEAAQWADVALGFENGDGDPKTIVIQRRGSQTWQLEVKGQAAHSSQIFTEKVGAGAIFEVARILETFYSELQSEKDLSFNPGLIIGGTDITYDASKSAGTAFGKGNVVAQDARVQGGLRASSPEQLQRVKLKMLQIVNNNYPHTTAQLSFPGNSYPPLAPTAGNKKLLQMYSKVSQDLGYGPVGPVDPRDAGAADISFTSELVEMAIDGMGMSGADDHTINETGLINMLPVQAKRAAILMYRLTH